MRNLLKRALAFLQSGWSAPLALLAVCVAAYGLWLPHLGFYWDSWPMNWIAQTMGSEGLARYFSTNRPVWGLFYQLTTPLLGGSPLPWQLSALLLRWLTGVAVWALVRLVWPSQKVAALAASLFFVVYPGFQQHSIGLLYTHFYLVLNAFLFSLVSTAAALRQPKRFKLLTGAALILSLVNLLSMEYFFMLELLRPVLIWLILGETIPWRKRWLPTLRHWLLYGVVFLGAGVWRALLFPYTENNYRLVVVEQLKAQPLPTLIRLAVKALEQTWIALGEAWGQVLSLPVEADAPLARRYWPAVVVCAGGLFAWLAAQKKINPQPKTRQGWSMLGAGAVGLLLAGWPFWLTDVPFSLQFAFDRFTLPFMLGASLLLGGLTSLLPLGRWLRAALPAALTALAVGFQIGAGYAYVQDWAAQKSLFWQLGWRIPALERGTLIIANETRSTRFSTDNSLTAALNWMYAPDRREGNLPYLLVYPSIRLGRDSLPALEKGNPSYKDYLVGEFRGSTDQALSIFYEPPGCLRVLEPTASNDDTLPDTARKTALLSKPALINPKPAVATQPMPFIFGAEPNHGWCYFYQKASLARQQGDWAGVAALGVEAASKGETPVMPVEWLPFIEAEARLGNWARAGEISLRAGAEKPNPGAAICALWKTLLGSTPESEQRTAAWSQVQVKLACGK